jgi:NADH-quinone oxidoreductase subunit J
MLNLREESVNEEKQWVTKNIWVGPSVLSFILLAELIFIIATSDSQSEIIAAKIVDAREVGVSLYTKYVIGVELSGILLMAGIVGAYHLGRQKKKVVHRFLEKIEDE